MTLHGLQLLQRFQQAICRLLCTVGIAPKLAGFAGAESGIVLCEARVCTTRVLLVSETPRSSSRRLWSLMAYSAPDEPSRGAAQAHRGKGEQEALLHACPNRQSLVDKLRSLKACLKDTKCSIVAPSAPPLEISRLSNSSLCAPVLSLSMMDAYADLWSHWSGRTPSAASTDPRKRMHALRGKA